MDIHTISRLNRFKAIVLTLIKYGFGDIIARLDLPERIIPVRIKRYSDAHKNTWVRIRLVMEELGPTFIKLGQILSLRSDLIPPSLALELTKLQDEVPPEELKDIKAQIEDSLEKPLDSIFSYFDPHPIAAASLAQVHKARLRGDNTVVAVKVQRPEILQTIKNDLRILSGLARRVHERIESMQPYNFPDLVEELQRLLLQELDFGREARNMRLARSNFSDDPIMYVPRVINEFTTEHVLVMELIKGDKLKHSFNLSLEAKKQLAVNGLRTILKQILQDGFFHADPHPGNIFVMDGGRFSMLDWGMIGRLTRQTRLKLISLLEGIIDKDSDQVLNILLTLSEHDETVNRNRLTRDIMDILDDYHSLPLKKINLGHLLADVTGICRNHRLRIRSDLAIMTKALVTSEGTARLLYPDLDAVTEAEPFVRRMVLQKYSPRLIWREFSRTMSDVVNMQKALPLQINNILQKMEYGKFTIGFEHKNLEGMRRTMEHVANRLTLAIITASMIIGSSMIITTGIKPYLFGYPALGLIGYLLSACFGGWLIIDILRKKKM